MTESCSKHVLYKIHPIEDERLWAAADSHHVISQMFIMNLFS